MLISSFSLSSGSGYAGAPGRTSPKEAVRSISMVFCNQPGEFEDFEGCAGGQERVRPRCLLNYFFPPESTSVKILLPLATSKEKKRRVDKRGSTGLSPRNLWAEPLNARAFEGAE